MASSQSAVELSDIIVVGAGVVGVTTALKLQSQGHQVLLVDRKGIAAETSSGNAGAFAFTDIEPLATPGIMRKAPTWLLDPLGPLSIPPAYALKLAPWMMRFWRSSWPDRYEASVAAQAGLMKLSRASLEGLVTQVDGEGLIRREGQLQLYEGKHEFQNSLPSWQLREQHGIAYRLLDTHAAIAEIQPGLHPRFTHAGFTPDWMNTVDPALWTEHLARQFLAKGGLFEVADVENIAQREDHVDVRTNLGIKRSRQIIVAAGAWSHHLAKTLGDAIPLETERGYNTTFPKLTFDLRTHVSFSNHGFVVSRIGDGFRVGGAVELGGLRLPPNFKRAEILLQKAVQFLPGLDPEGGKQWMGYRPSMPDSLPAIGRSPLADRVIYAFGHGHLGLTQSAGTAELVSCIVQRKDTPIPLKPFLPTRFSR